jgi:hypothetical protein
MKLIEGATLAEAAERAIPLSRQWGYSCIILSRGHYHIETEPTMIRVFEELIAEYENGELVVNP